MGDRMTIQRLRRQRAELGKGRIAESHSDMVDRQAFERDIQELLHERPD